MKSDAQKNRMMFFGGTAIVSMVAIFISFATFAMPQTARAYAVGTLPTSSQPASGSYNFGNSLQNLVSPFTNFITSLGLNTGTTIDTHGETPAFKVTNYTPAVENSIQTTVSGWVNEFDNWVDGKTGINLSGIFQVLLSAIAWTLGLAQQAVNWLLGLFH